MIRQPANRDNHRRSQCTPARCHRRRQLLVEALEERRLLALSPGDLVVGSGLGSAGEIRIFDGDGAEQSRIPVPSQDRRGVPVAVGDVNRDGTPDIVAGAGYGGPAEVRVFSGIDNTELLRLLPYGETSRRGVFVATADLDGDGVAEIMTSPARGKDPTVQVFSGVDGTQLLQFAAHHRPVSGGGVKLAAGDIDGDGQREIITGMRISGKPWVKVFAGTDGSLLHEIEVGRRGESAHGVEVTAADVLGNGSDQIIVGTGRGNRSTLRVLDGDGVQLKELTLDSGGRKVRLATADVDLDGRDDIITGSGLGMRSRVEVFSGADFSNLNSFQPFGMHDRGGVFVAGVPTVDSLTLEAYLANDTSPGGTNNDGLTSDASLTASITNPSGSPTNPTTLYVGIDDPMPLQAAGQIESMQATIRLDDEALRLLHGGPLADGPHVVYLQVRDTQGNHTNVVPVAFTLDTTPPQLSSITPEHGFVAQSNFTIEGQAADAVAGAAVVRVQLDDDLPVEVQLDDSGRFQFDTTFALDGSDDGVHMAGFEVMDRAGNHLDGLMNRYWLAAVGQLPGPDGELANEHIPEIPFPPATAAEFTESGGQSISRTSLGIMFAENATVAEINTLFSAHGVSVVAGEPKAGVVYAAIDDTADLDQMISVVSVLNASPLIAAAAPNATMVPRGLPIHHEDQLGGAWFYDTNVQGGNNGLELVRAPQMWNLRTHAMRADSRTELGVIDVGFDASHPDLTPRLQTPAGTPLADHGVHVAGIMGGTWDNAQGVEGIAAHNPTIHARVFNPGSTFRVATWLQDVQTLFGNILANQPDVVAVNMSYGYPNYSLQVNPQTDSVSLTNPLTFASFTDRVGDIFHLSAEWFAQLIRSDFLIAAAVGYDARPGIVRVQDDSPMSNAAVRKPDGHFLAVEAVDANNQYDPAQMDFNLGGSVAAPGYGIRSAEVAGGGDAFPSDGDPDYATFNGTSMATPFVTGLIGHLWQLDRSLTFSEVRDLVTDPNYTVLTDAPNFRTVPRIDAFAAALGIDDFDSLGRMPIQRALVDVDDGTADGNRRLDPFSEVVTTGLATSDQFRGDGKVTMSDFRAWRDAYLQIHESAFTQEGLSILLDGPASHFKRDLNQDGCVADQARTTAASLVATQGPAASSCQITPDENVFPRFDFNGDGVIGHWTTVAPFKIDPDTAISDTVNHVAVPHAFDPTARPGLLRDIDVLADPDIWSNDEADGYSENVAIDPALDGQAVGDQGPWQSWAYLLQQHDPPEASEFLKLLPDYIHSFDLHLDVDWLAINPDYEEVVVTVESEKAGPNFANVFAREVRVSRGMELPIVATMPLWTGNVQVSYRGIDRDQPEPGPADEGALPGSVERFSNVQLGQDLAVVVLPSSQTTLHTIFNPDPQDRGFPPQFLPGDIEVDSTGRTHFAYQHNVGGFTYTAVLNVAYSDDGGETVIRKELAGGDGEFTRRPSFTGVELSLGPNDELYLTYSTFLKNVGSEIWFTRSLDRGESFSEPLRLSTDGDGPDVTVDANGAVHVIWSREEQLLMQTSTDEGATFGDPELIAFDSDWPYLAQIEAGDARQEGEASDLHVTWVASDGSGFPALYYSRRQADGSWSSKATIADEVQTTPFRCYDLTFSDSGLAGVLYVDGSDSSFLTSLYYQPILGGQLLDRKLVSKSPDFSDHFGNPALRIDDTGVVWTAWHHFNGPMTVAVSADGGATFDEILVGGEFAAEGIGLALDASQNALVTWSEGDRAQRDLFFRQLGVSPSPSLAPAAVRLPSRNPLTLFWIDESNVDRPIELDRIERSRALAWDHAERRGQRIAPTAPHPPVGVTGSEGEQSPSPLVPDHWRADCELVDQVLAGLPVLPRV